MATGGSGESDVSEMFHRMGEKLGWFQHKDLDTALKSLSKSGKKNRSRQKTEGAQSKEGRKKTNSAKSAKVKKKEIDQGVPHIPVKRTTAHTNLPKTLGLIDTDSSDCDDGSDNHDRDKKDRQKTTINILDFSSSDEDMPDDSKRGVNNVMVKGCDLKERLSDSENCDDRKAKEPDGDDGSNNHDRDKKDRQKTTINFLDLSSSDDNMTEGSKRGVDNSIVKGCDLKERLSDSENFDDRKAKETDIKTHADAMGKGNICETAAVHATDIHPIALRPARSECNRVKATVSQKLEWLDSMDEKEEMQECNRVKTTDSQKLEFSDSMDEKKEMQECNRVKTTVSQKLELSDSIDEKEEMQECNRVKTTDSKKLEFSDSMDEIEEMQECNRVKTTDSQKLELSDSMDEKEEMQDTYVSCVGESYFEQASLRQDENTKEKRKSSDYITTKCKLAHRISAFSDNDTILLKPPNIAAESFSPEIDMTFGEPQGESTRIHRRSSVTYRHVIGSPEDMVQSPELDSSGISEDKNYQTCIDSTCTSTADLLNSSEDSESPLVETVFINSSNDSNTNSNSYVPQKLKTNDKRKENNENDDLCRGLDNLDIGLENQCKNISQREEGLETSQSSANIEAEFITHECSGESIEVIDACVQTDNNETKPDSSLLNYSVSQENYSFIQEKSRSSRNKFESSEDCFSDNDDGSQSDLSEKEVRDISTQTENHSTTDVNKLCTHDSIADTKNAKGNSDLLGHKSNNEIECEHQLKIEKDQHKTSGFELSEDSDTSSYSSKNKILESEISDDVIDNVIDSVFKEKASISDTESDEAESETSNDVIDNENGSVFKKKANISDTESDEENSDRDSGTGIGKITSVISSSPDRSVGSGDSPLSNTSEPADRSVENQSSNTWRSPKKLSISSSDDDLEAYLEKLRNPKKSSSSDQSNVSPVSMKDFIVDDDEISSESDDSAFYIRETRKLEDTKPVQRKQTTSTKVSGEINISDSEDSDFSIDKYPGSVTKHKRKTTKAKTRSNSWSLSSDEDLPVIKIKGKTRRQTEPEEKHKHPTNVKKTISGDENDNAIGKHKNMTIDTLHNSDEEMLFKTPKLLKRVTKNKSNKENQSDKKLKSLKLHDLDDNEDKRSRKIKTPKLKNITFSDSDSDGDFNGVADESSRLPDVRPPVLKELTGNSKVKSRSLCDEEDVLRKTSTSESKVSQPKFFTPQPVRPRYGFLKSLTINMKDQLRDPEAVRFVTGFKKKKEELSQHLFKLYNQSVFDNMLPSDLPIEWNKRLLRTAGYCVYKRNPKNSEDRSVRIELSTKVCDSTERVRDTLIHELCHAAVWLINGLKEGHGRYWKYWARKSNQAHPDIPVIARCHDYSINTKFTYQCVKCGYSIGRHSKSLDTEKKVCGYCHGQFELVQNSTSRSCSRTDPMTPKTPRTPNRFALYVKEHYNNVKQKDKSMKHGDVMKELSKQFAEMNKT